MKTVKFVKAFSCEVCGALFRDIEDAQEHEASHYGLTKDAYCEWGRLFNNMKNANADRLLRRDHKTQKEFDEACSALTNFRIKYDIPDDEIEPLNFGLE